MLWGFHGSRSTSLPMLQQRAAATTAAALPSTGPPRRQAAAIVPVTIVMSRRTMPIATPRPWGSSRTGTARRSNSRGPGWLRSKPSVSDADDHVPRRGSSPPKTSRARMTNRALSPTGNQPSASARTAATTTGTTARAAAATTIRRGASDSAGAAGSDAGSVSERPASADGVTAGA
jgi:hypothetical protein